MEVITNSHHCRSRHLRKSLDRPLGFAGDARAAYSRTVTTSAGSWKPVADPRFGQEIRRVRGLRLDLLSQLVHEDAEVVDLIAVVGTPDRLQQLAMRRAPCSRAPRGSGAGRIPSGSDARCGRGRSPGGCRNPPRPSRASGVRSAPASTASAASAARIRASSSGALYGFVT